MGEGQGLNEQIAVHFGRAPAFIMVDSTNREFKVFENNSHHMGGEKSPAELLKEWGVDTLICSGLGRRAIDFFNAEGIEVYIGAEGNVSDTLDMFAKGKLCKATQESACTEHTFRSSDKEHEHHH